MKKALIPVILIACAAFASQSPNALGLSCSGSHITAALASPVVWSIWDAVLSKVLARVIGDASQPSASPESVCDSVAPLVVAAMLGHVLESTRAVEPQNSIRAVSISPCLVRRIVEREFATVREGSAYRRGRQNRG